jgi:hypothetical protein
MAGRDYKTSVEASSIHQFSINIASTIIKRIFGVAWTEHC